MRKNLYFALCRDFCNSEPHERLVLWHKVRNSRSIFIWAIYFEFNWVNSLESGLLRTSTYFGSTLIQIREMLQLHGPSRLLLTSLAIVCRACWCCNATVTCTTRWAAWCTSTPHRCAGRTPRLLNSASRAPRPSSCKVSNCVKTVALAFLEPILCISDCFTSSCSGWRMGKGCGTENELGLCTHWTVCRVTSNSGLGVNSKKCLYEVIIVPQRPGAR